VKFRDFHALLAPPLFWLLLFFVVPLLLAVACSFGPQDVYGGVLPGFTLEHYARLFDPVYLDVYRQSLAYALGTTVATLLLAYPIAYFMAFAGNRVKAVAMFLVMLPFWTNFLVRTYSLIILLGNDGVVNKALLGLGIVDQPLPLLYNSFAVYVGFIYVNLPFMLLPLFSSLDRMPRSHLEAAMDLGAGPVRSFLTVTLPNSIPGLAAGVVFVFIPTLGNFVVPQLLGGTGDVIVGSVVSRQFLESRNWPFGSAMATLLVLLLVAVISLYIRFFDPMNKKNLAAA
jgi:spermidine/putrescine transport system permease protein